MILLGVVAGVELIVLLQQARNNHSNLAGLHSNLKEIHSCKQDHLKLLLRGAVLILLQLLCRLATFVHAKDLL